MWQHCNNISCREYRTGLDVDGINQLIDTLENDSNVLRFTIILRLCLMLVKAYVYSILLLHRVGGGKMCVSQSIFYSLSRASSPPGGKVTLYFLDAKITIQMQ
jgi:hypothetical protein